MLNSFIPRVFSFFARHELLNFIPDKKFLEWRYRVVTHEKLNIEHPAKFNEKIQWLKLYNRCPRYIDMVDKSTAKKYVSEKIGAEYVVPTLGGPWKSCDEIDWEGLPDKFVLKCTHNSGNGVVIIHDKKSMNKSEVIRQLERGLSSNFFWAEREWPYKFIEPQIIAEEYLEDSSTGQLMDYKVHVFNGVSRIIQVDFDRFTEHKRNLYDSEWNYIEGEIEYPTHPEIQIRKPEKLPVMLELSEKLAEGMPYVRVDFYIVNGRIYFGELTFYHGGGLERMIPPSLNMKMGSWIHLPERSNVNG